MASRPPDPPSVPDLRGVFGEPGLPDVGPRVDGPTIGPDRGSTRPLPEPEAEPPASPDDAPTREEMEQREREMMEPIDVADEDGGSDRPDNESDGGDEGGSDSDS